MDNNAKFTEATRNATTGIVGFANGFLGALFPALAMVIFGVISLAFGLKAIGYILIFMGIIFPFIGIFGGTASCVEGDCPYCGYRVRDITTNESLACPSCKEIIVVRDNKFWTVPK